MTGVAVVFLVFDSIIKVRALGVVAVLGTVELVTLALYALPQTSVLGAILMTGFLAGAVAAQLQSGNPRLIRTLLPILLVVLTWGGLLLRDGGLRSLIPQRR